MRRSYTNRNFWTPKIQKVDPEQLMRDLGTRIVIVDYDCLADEDDIISAAELDAVLRFEQFTDWPVTILARWQRRNGARLLAETINTPCVIDRWRHPAQVKSSQDEWWLRFAWQQCGFHDSRAALYTLVVTSHLYDLITCSGTGVATLTITPTAPTVVSLLRLP